MWAKTGEQGRAQAQKGEDLTLPDKLIRENQELRERLARLSQASLRINESLDFDTVLQEVVDNARSLTASRYGAITVLGDAGQPPHFIVSGLSGRNIKAYGTCRRDAPFSSILAGWENPCGFPMWRVTLER